ncbi:MAG: FMN-binding protein [Sedimentisphaerales bacterium]|nr:FMN-binding protein [Sedimentisphaerales bacterium]
MSKIKLFIQESWLLLVSAFFFGLLIAVADKAWTPKIEQNKLGETNQKMTSLIPAAVNFEQTADAEIDLGAGKKSKSRIYKALSADGQCIGWTLTAEGSGFADKIEMIIAVDKNFEKIAGIDFASINETPGFGDNANKPAFRNQFAQAPAEDLKLTKTGDAGKIDAEIVAITGATVTSTAVVNSVNNYIKPVKEYMLSKGLIQNGK